MSECYVPSEATRVVAFRSLINFTSCFPFGIEYIPVIDMAIKLAQLKRVAFKKSIGDAFKWHPCMTIPSYFWGLLCAFGVCNLFVTLPK